MHAAGQGWPGHAIRLSATLFHYLETGAQFADAITIHGNARHAARQVGDQGAEAAALNSLGVIDLRQGRFGAAAGHLEQALALYRQAGDLTGEARALSNLGFVDFMLGRCRRAIDYLTQSLGIARQIGDQASEARELATLGFFQSRQGNDEQAMGDLQRALTLSRLTGDRGCQGRVLATLGEIDLRQGRHEQAAARVSQGLTLFREIGDRVSESDALTILGLVRRGRASTSRPPPCSASPSRCARRPGTCPAAPARSTVLARCCSPPAAPPPHVPSTRPRSRQRIKRVRSTSRPAPMMAWPEPSRPTRPPCRRATTGGKPSPGTPNGAPEADRIRAQLAQATGTGG